MIRLEIKSHLKSPPTISAGNLLEISGLSNIAQKPRFCDTPKSFQKTQSHVFETHIDDKL